jgi:DNA invertase Pin-like site-specific DNA recombinase
MFRNIPSAALRELVKLSERKEALMGQIQEVDRQMVHVQAKFGIPVHGDDQAARVTVSRVTGRRRARRGALKEKIVVTLRKAGEKGVTIRELARKLNVPSANLYVWFNSTGRNVPEIRKIGVAKYRLGAG